MISTWDFRLKLDEIDPSLSKRAKRRTLAKKFKCSLQEIDEAWERLNEEKARAFYEGTKTTLK